LNCTLPTIFSILCGPGELPGLQGEQVHRLSRHPLLAYLRAPALKQVTDGPLLSSQGPLQSRFTAGAAACLPALPVVACLHLVPSTLRKSDVYRVLCSQLPRASCQHVFLDDGASQVTSCCCPMREICCVLCATFCSVKSLPMYCIPTRSCT
jgi:hypothetical protein